MQQFLACGFEAADFHVVENTVGVPDFIATSPMVEGDCQTFAVEVKTTDKSKVVPTQRDLDGIRTSGQIGVFAVLMFPSMSPGWILIPANSISARSWEIRHLMMKQKVDVGFDVDDMFHRVVAGLETNVATGGPDLEGWIKAQRHTFLAMSSQQSAQ
jgi:hypothetical protein